MGVSSTMRQYAMDRTQDMNKHRADKYNPHHIVSAEGVYAILANIEHEIPGFGVRDDLSQRLQTGRYSCNYYVAEKEGEYAQDFEQAASTRYSRYNGRTVEQVVVETNTTGPVALSLYNHDLGGVLMTVRESTEELLKWAGCSRENSQTVFLPGRAFPPATVACDRCLSAVKELSDKCNEQLKVEDRELDEEIWCMVHARGQQENTDCTAECPAVSARRLGEHLLSVVHEIEKITVSTLESNRLINDHGAADNISIRAALLLQPTILANRASAMLDHANKNRQVGTLWLKDLAAADMLGTMILSLLCMLTKRSDYIVTGYIDPNWSLYVQRCFGIACRTHVSVDTEDGFDWAQYPIGISGIQNGNIVTKLEVTGGVGHRQELPSSLSLMLEDAKITSNDIDSTRIMDEVAGGCGDPDPKHQQSLQNALQDIMVIRHQEGLRLVTSAKLKVRMRQILSTFKSFTIGANASCVTLGFTLGKPVGEEVILQQMNGRFVANRRPKHHANDFSTSKTLLSALENAVPGFRSAGYTEQQQIRTEIEIKLQQISKMLELEIGGMFSCWKKLVDTIPWGHPGSLGMLQYVCDLPAVLKAESLRYYTAPGLGYETTVPVVVTWNGVSSKNMAYQLVSAANKTRSNAAMVHIAHITDYGAKLGGVGVRDFKAPEGVQYMVVGAQYADE